MVEAGQRLSARYRLEERLGAGASATCWRAHDEVEGRGVALKILRRPDAAGRERLLRELDRLQGLRHPNLVEVLELEVHDGSPFLVTRLVEGEPLGVWAEGRPDDAILGAVADAVTGLAFLHELGVRHGDVKPANVIVDESGRGVLIDLGCAAALGAPLDEVSGTPRYMAPELRSGRDADARSDLYALGVMLEELLGTPSPLATRLREPEPSGRPSEAREVLELLGRPGPRGAPLGRAPRLLGRHTLVGEVEACLDDLCASRPGSRVLLLEGADGVGRTRSLREITFAAQRRVRTVAGGRSVSALLGRALERELGPGLDALLDARDALASSPTPTVLVVDDAHALDDAERAHLGALTRSAQPRDALLVLLAARPGAVALEGEACAVWALEPLSRESLRRWGEGIVDDVDALARASGGVPSRVEALLGAVASGAITEAELARLDVGARVAPRDAETARVLAALAASDGWLEDTWAERWALSEDALLGLQRSGAIRRRADGWRATRSLAVEVPASMHGDLAEHTTGAGRARHLASAGRTDEALRALAAARPAEDPGSWARAVDALGRAALVSAPDAALVAGHAYAVAGRARDALRLYAALLRARPEPPLAGRVRVAAGIAALHAGDARRAARLLSRATSDAPAEAREALARARIELGDYRGAEALVGAEVEADALPRAALEVRGIARTYLGVDGARADLEAALARLPADAPRERARVCSYLAIADFRAGDLESAARRYEEALAVAEAHALSDLLATAALNLGTVRQQLGDWGAALRCYERAARVARALGRTSTLVTVEHNLANLYAGVGAPERAEHTLSRVEVEARRAGLAYFEGAVASLRGELRRDRGCFSTALSAFEAIDARREVAECALHLAALSREGGALEEARGWLDRAEVDAADLRVRRAIERGRWLSASGQPAEALRELEAARGGALEVGELHLEGELEAALADVAEAGGAEGLANAHRAAARRLFERIALTLPEAHREGFLAKRRAARATGATARRGDSGGRSLAERLLSLNARLNSSLSTDRVLEHAIDAAVDLTGAERGFILLKEGDALEVAVARNLDRERVGRSHLKFSRTIAERVLRSGEPLLTTDARHDARFRENESVHAMRLSSIVCVPIAAPRGVLGAIYLDNRFERGRFEEADVATLVACSDQIAIALENARLVAALERRTRELEAEQARVRELLADREAEIARLEGEVSRGSVAPASGGFPEIVGRGAAMQQLLSLVSRVMDSPLSVVVQGESGTGKELVARAIHEHGPRAGRPFVAINCGALPDTLLEGELFGWVRGAFTGAERDRPGIFARARGGTVFLDEIGETSAAMQTKLLRVLQQSEVTPLGSTEVLKVDARIVAATNRTLRDEVAAGRFREDLYYRLAVVELAVPPLRARREDVVALARHLLARRARALELDVPDLHPEAARRLLRHDWPGNVRELENVLSRALVMGDGAMIRPEDLGLELGPGAAADPERVTARDRRQQAELEEREILAALAESRWNVAEVSRLLGIPRTTLYRKMRRYGIGRAR